MPRKTEKEYNFKWTISKQITIKNASMQIKKMEFFEGKNLILLKYVQIGFMKFIFQRMFEIQLCRRKINFLKLTLNVEDTCYYVMLNMIL